jgi:aquaporin Z
MNKYLTEFIGTFFLCLVIGLTVIREFPTPAFPIGVTLMVMVYMGGHISGGHYNPAVSVAALMRGALPSGQFVPYVVSQFLGAIAAGMLTGVLTGDVVSPAPSPDVNILLAVLVELLFTFALALVVLNVATSPKTQGNSYYGLAIGFTVFAGVAASANIGGGALNPAVGAGLGLVDGIMGGAPLNHIWVYLVGPTLGGALASAVYTLQHNEPKTAS